MCSYISTKLEGLRAGCKPIVYNTFDRDKCATKDVEDKYASCMDEQQPHQSYSFKASLATQLYHKSR